jgi:Tripartite tricarboxylate transporter family receptor
VAEFVPGFEASQWFAVGLRKSTQAEIVDRLNKEINAILADPEMRARLADLGTTVLAGSAADFGKFIVATGGWGRGPGVIARRLARPGGNATGVIIFAQEVVVKRLALLHALVPKAVRVAVLINPADGTNAETNLRDVQEAARTLGLQIQVLNATTISCSTSASKCSQSGHPRI